MLEQQMWEIIAIVEKEIRHPLAEVLYKEAFDKCKIEGTNFNFVLTSPKITVEK